MKAIMLDLPTILRYLKGTRLLFSIRNARSGSMWPYNPPTMDTM
jgi:hypothetical protein